MLNIDLQSSIMGLTFENDFLLLFCSGICWHCCCRPPSSSKQCTHFCSIFIWHHVFIMEFYNVFGQLFNRCIRVVFILMYHCSAQVFKNFFDCCIRTPSSHIPDQSFNFRG
eukprot:Lithocolla_globosa_v1_NODE_293_length_4619_cov_21.870508.p2 type:complete len:111 gc:universal NODE_293_length_4619_cov_21.870508:3732-4064(+)